MPVGVRLSLCVCSNSGCGGWRCGGVHDSAARHALSSMFDVQCSRDKPASSEIETQLAMALQKGSVCLSLSPSLCSSACLPRLSSIFVSIPLQQLRIHFDAHANFVSAVSVVVDVDVNVGCKDRTCLALPRARLGLPNRTPTLTWAHSTLRLHMAFCLELRAQSKKQRCRARRAALLIALQARAGRSSQR